MYSPFCFNRSYGLAIFYGAVHVAALLALVASALPLPALLPMAALLIVHGAGLLRRALMADGDAPAVLYAEDTEVLLTLANGRKIPVTPWGIYCTSWLQVVHFRRRGTVTGPGFWLTVVAGSTDSDSHRLLRAWLLSTRLGQGRETDQDRD